jgi:hypothetical protein
MSSEDRFAQAKYVFGEKDLTKKFKEQEKCIDALPVIKLTMTA